MRGQSKAFLKSLRKKHGLGEFKKRGRKSYRQKSGRTSSKRPRRTRITTRSSETSWNSTKLGL